MYFVRSTTAQGDGIHVEVKRFLDTVYLDITMDGMAKTARVVQQYGGDYRSQWDTSMEKLRALNEQYWGVMIDKFGLKNYNFSLCLMNDEDTEYVLAEFINGKMERSVVD